MKKTQKCFFERQKSKKGFSNVLVKILISPKTFWLDPLELSKNKLDSQFIGFAFYKRGVSVLTNVLLWLKKFKKRFPIVLNKKFNRFTET